MEFHEKLYTLRRAANMTQTDLAEKLNVSRQAVSRWEMGTAKPEIDTLIAISDLFGVTLDELLKGEAVSASESKASTEPEPEPKPRWDKNWPWLMLILYGALWVVVAFANLDPTGAVIIAAIPVALIWGLKVLICAIIKFLLA